MTRLHIERALEAPHRARVVGVALLDFLHGQTGVARNGIELHPVLGFACLSGPKPPPPKFDPRSKGASCPEPERLLDSTA